jgi:predicted nucleic acid-binding protein
VTLVDSSVWIEHFRRPDTELAELVEADRVLMHPFVLGELSLGQFRERDLVLVKLRMLESLPLLPEAEVDALVRRFRLWGHGVGWVDCHLMASARSAQAQLLTRDKALNACWNLVRK